MNNQDHPINPQSIKFDSYGEIVNDFDDEAFTEKFIGLTKKEHISILVLQSLAPQFTKMGNYGDIICEPHKVAKIAVRYAKALLETLDDNK